jgi:hypothetical protein
MSVLNSSDWTSDQREVSLRPDQVAVLGQVLRDWAEVHPRRDRPFMYILDEFELTPRDFADAVNNPSSQWHQAVIHVFSASLSGFVGGGEVAFQQTLDIFRRDTESFRVGSGQVRRRG